MWTMKFAISCYVRPHSLVEVYRCFWGTYCRHLQDGIASHVSCNQTSPPTGQYSSYSSQWKPQMPQLVNHMRHLHDTMPFECINLHNRFAQRSREVLGSNLNRDTGYLEYFSHGSLQSLNAKTRTVLWLARYRFLLNPFQFIFHAMQYRSCQHRKIDHIEGVDQLR
jgi:hypothetical protein